MTRSPSGATSDGEFHPDLAHRLHVAITDPGRIVEREKAGEYVNESLMEWQYRAVCAVIEEESNGDA